jgi:hypothetical protein
MKVMYPLLSPRSQCFSYGRKLDGPTTHACNSKINKYSRLSFIEECVFYEAPFGRNTAYTIGHVANIHGRVYIYILWRIEPLLGNDSVKIFEREPTRSTMGRLLLDNGSVNTPKTIRDNRRQCSPWVPPRGYITRSFKGAVSCQKLRKLS